MIKLADSAIMLILENGEIVAFEPERLQSGIVRSFIATGIRDSWLAEDIALAVEFALAANNKGDKVLAVSELNATVVKILEASGYPEAASYYKHHHAMLEVAADCDSETVAGLLKNHLGVTGPENAALTDKVMLAAERLGIGQAAPTLYVELGRYFKSVSTPLPELQPVKIAKHNLKAPWLVTQENLEGGLSASTRALVERGIVSVNGISSLFPSLRLEIRFIKLAACLNLEPVITEMILIPHFQELAAALNDCARQAFVLSGQNEMPVFVNVPDMSLFAVKYLDADWPEAKKDCREMLNCLARQLEFNIFRLRIN